MSLVEELKLYGSDMDAEAFNDVLQELHAVMYPQWNMEQLLYEPQEALQFCKAIRARAGRRLPDGMILRRLNNVRKNGAAERDD